MVKFLTCDGYLLSYRKRGVNTLKVFGLFDSTPAADFTPENEFGAPGFKTVACQSL